MYCCVLLIVPRDNRLGSFEVILELWYYLMENPMFGIGTQLKFQRKQYLLEHLGFYWNIQMMPFSFYSFFFK